MRVGCTDVGPSVCWTTNDHRHIDQSARHVAYAAGVVDNLIEANVGKAPKHELDHGSESHHGGSHPETEESSLADRGVDHALRAKALPEPLGDFVGTVILSHLFAHEKNILVAGEFLCKGGVERLAVSDDGHGWKKGKYRMSLFAEKVAASLASLGPVIDFVVDVLKDALL